MVLRATGASRDLSPRRNQVLKLIVEEYVSSAEPVGSETVARRFGQDISSATVRNEMAVLEDLGLIYQPHTSAGRVPTDRGYRYYIEHLMDHYDLPVWEKRTISHQFHQVESDLGEWVRLAIAVMANSLRTAAAMATPPTAPQARLRRLELVPVHDRLVLVTLITQSGAVRQQFVHLDDDLDRDELTRMSNRLSDLCQDKTAGGVASTDAGGNVLEKRFLDSAARLLRLTDEQSLEEVYFEGLSHVLAQPEFSSGERIRPVIQVLERANLLRAVLTEVLWASGIQVIIGQENSLEQMRHTSMVLSRYGKGDEIRGVLGVLGSTRMPYWRAISMVRFMASLMDLLVAESFR